MAQFVRFEDIIAWQKARVLTLEIYSATRTGIFSKDFGLKDQLQRAAVSIGSNIAEGFERNGNREFVNFLYIAKGSAGEVQSQLYTAKDLKYVSEDDFKRLYGMADEIMRMIGALIKSIKSSSYKGTKYA